MKEFHFAHNEHTGELSHVTERLYNDIRERQVNPEETKYHRSYVNNTAVVRHEVDGKIWYDVNFGNVDFHLIKSVNFLLDAHNWGKPDDFT